jgi:hypothetical protein
LCSWCCCLQFDLAVEAREVGDDIDYADERVKPFAELRFLRTRLSAHAGGTGAAQERQKLLKEHGMRRRHKASLAGRLVAALKDAHAILCS